MNMVKKTALLAGILLALTFTLSCSGDDGRDGKDGTGCVLAGNVLTCDENRYTIEDGKNCVPRVDDNGSVFIKCGTAAEIMLSCGGSPFNAKTQICDARDGNAYRKVEIDGVVWLAENVKFKTANSVCYGGLKSNCAKYGGLYTWAEAKGACPNGWSLPESDDFAALIALVEDASELKSEEIGGTDALGFGALLGGYNGRSGFAGEGSLSYFWSNTENNDNNSQSNFIIISTQTNTSQSADKADMLSVRCIEN